MTHREIDLLADLTSHPLNRSCSDYRLPNTDENWSIVEAALAANVHKTVEQYRADVNDIEYRERPAKGDIKTEDYLIHHYLMAKALRELREAV